MIFCSYMFVHQRVYQISGRQRNLAVPGSLIFSNESEMFRCETRRHWKWSLVQLHVHNHLFGWLDESHEVIQGWKRHCLWCLVLFLGFPTRCNEHSLQRELQITWWEACGMFSQDLSILFTETQGISIPKGTTLFNSETSWLLPGVVVWV